MRSKTERPMLKRVHAELAEAIACGWSTGTPQQPGRYRRLTAIGIQTDYWDGEQWRRITGRKQPVIGTICANQLMPWL